MKRRFKFNPFEVMMLLLMTLLVVTAVGVLEYTYDSTVEASDEPISLMQQPWRAVQDTLSVSSGDSISRAFRITGAKRVGISVPTLTSATFNLRGGYDTDSTFTFVWHASDESLFEVGAGTGAFSIDVTDIVAGFEYMQIWLGAAQAAIRTFHITIKY